jgi:exosortase/archaeosortase family protein
MEQDTKDILDMAIRYVLLIVVAFPNLYIFYKIFTPLTTWGVYYLLKIFFDVSLSLATISFNVSCLTIELIPACIAGSAYYLLTILNFSTPNLSIKKRFYVLFSSYFSFFILNVIRIFILSILLLNSSSFFDFSHKVSWYVISTLMVVIIWFAEVKIFNIESIPVYSDIKSLLIKSNLVSENS